MELCTAKSWLLKLWSLSRGVKCLCLASPGQLTITGRWGFLMLVDDLSNSFDTCAMAIRVYLTAFAAQGRPPTPVAKR
jgi:hypothetical protein